MTGVIRHVYTSPVPDGTATSVVRPSDWNSGHVFTLQDGVLIGGNTSGATASISSGTFFLAGGNNVTLSQNANSVTIVGAAQSVQPRIQSMSAGGTRITTGEAIFADSNGVSFGVNGQSITATVKTDYQSSGAYLTTAMQSNAATISNIKISGGVLSQFRSDVTFGDSNGISFGLSNNGVMTGTVKTDYALSDHSHGNPTLALTNLTGTTASNSAGFTLSLSGPGAGGGGITNIKLSAGTLSVFRSDLTFSNSNGVTFGLDTNGLLTATVRTNYQSAGAYLTTAALSQDSSNYAGTNGAVTGGSLTVNTSGISINLPAYLTTAMQSNAVTLSNIKISAGTLSANRSDITYSDSNGISFGLNTNGVLTGTVQTNYLTVQTNEALSGSNGSFTYQTATFGNLNGMSFYTSNGSMVGSYTVPGTTISSYEANNVGVQQTMTLNGGSVSNAVAFILPQPGSFSYFRLPVSMTTNSTTLATSAATANMSVSLVSTWNVVVYSLGTGASSRSLVSVASGSNGWTFMNSISVAVNGSQYSVSQFFSAQAEGAGTTRTTQYSITNTNMSFSTNQIATEWSGGRFLDIPLATSLSAGAYWAVFGYSSNSAANSIRVSNASNCAVFYSNHYGVSNSNMAFGVMGSTNLTSGAMIGAGSFSTAGGGTTSILPLSAISSSSSHVQPYFQMLRQA